jgi:hypothetical protein
VQKNISGIIKLVRIAEAKPWEQMKKFGPLPTSERKDLYQKYASNWLQLKLLLC